MLNDGISFVIRTRNEEGTLEESVRSLFRLSIPYEIVLVLHLCTDGSRAIAERLQAENAKIRIFEYTVETSRAGFETLATDAMSPHSLPTYYAWCLEKTQLPWVFKWDADFVATDGLVDYLNGIQWKHMGDGGRYEFQARNAGFIATECYLINKPFFYKKYIFWEQYLCRTGGNVLNSAKSNDVHIVHASPQHVVKSHWTRTPWYEVEDSDEARTVKERMRRLVEDFGQEPNGLARCGNDEANTIGSRILNARPDYVNFEG